MNMAEGVLYCGPDSRGIEHRDLLLALRVGR